MSRLSAVWILESTQMRFVPLCVQMELSWEENLSIFPVKKTRCTAVSYTHLMGDPIKALSSPSRLFSGFAFLVLAIICLVELICYFGWFHKAKAAAEYGEFLKTPHTATFQKIIIAVILLGALYWIISYIILGSPLERWVAVLMLSLIHI